jgi:hypothetical protein
MKYLLLLCMCINIAILFVLMTHGASVLSLAFTLLCVFACGIGYKNKATEERWKD